MVQRNGFFAPVQKSNLRLRLHLMEPCTSEAVTANFMRWEQMGKSGGNSRPERGWILHRRLPKTEQFTSDPGTKSFTLSIPTVRRNGNSRLRAKSSRLLR